MGSGIHAKPLNPGSLREPAVPDRPGVYQRAVGLQGPNGVYYWG